MAKCERCGNRYRQNWVRMQPCPACRKAKVETIDLTPGPKEIDNIVRYIQALWQSGDHRQAGRSYGWDRRWSWYRATSRWRRH